MNWEYRRVASGLGFAIDRTRADDLLDFPIEKARLRATYFYMSVAAATTIGYGWALDNHTHFAVPLVLQFFIGASITGVFNVRMSKSALDHCSHIPRLVELYLSTSIRFDLQQLVRPPICFVAFLQAQLWQPWTS